MYSHSLQECQDRISALVFVDGLSSIILVLTYQNVNILPLKASASGRGGGGGGGSLIS